MSEHMVDPVRLYRRGRLWYLFRVSDVGAFVLDALAIVGQLGRLSCAVVASLWRDRQRREVYMRQCYHIGYLSLPVVILTGLSIGMVMAVQAYSTLSKFRGENMSGAMVNFSLITQLLPVLTGLTLAGRVGSSVAAEIGTMKVTEQLDALRVMGTDPIAYLVAPRFLACVILLPALTAIGALVGILGAAGLTFSVWDINSAAYWRHSEEVVGTWEIATGLGKTVVYGGIIALVACRRGLRTDGGASGVGTACTGAVVSASMLILVATFFMTVIFEQLHHLLWPY